MSKPWNEQDDTRLTKPGRPPSLFGNMGRAWAFIDCTLMEELGEVSPAALRGYEEFIATRIVPDLKRFGKQQNIISQQIKD